MQLSQVRNGLRRYLLKPDNERRLPNTIEGSRREIVVRQCIRLSEHERWEYNYIIETLPSGYWVVNKYILNLIFFVRTTKEITPAFEIEFSSPIQGKFNEWNTFFKKLRSIEQSILFNWSQLSIHAFFFYFEDNCEIFSFPLTTSRQEFLSKKASLYHTYLWARSSVKVFEGPCM